jgi:O-antigen/teichoic acid export membrane protein
MESEDKITPSHPINNIYSGRIVAKNIIYNLLGYGIPLIVAIALIPPLIKGLGDEKFGILNLAWVVIGYFSFFDFGIGRALTKIIAEKIGLNETKDIPGLFWTSLLMMLIISLVGAIIIIILTPHLVYNVFNITKDLQSETINTFYILALSIPLVTTTAGLRGVLEAYQKFGIINIIRIALGVSTFLGPVLCLFFTNSLFWIVILLVFIRTIIWILYLFECFKLDAIIKDQFKFEVALVKPILRLSGWMTVSNIVGPLIIYMDRFLIGAIISAAAITYYATPYEVVTKLLIIPGALVGVLFPAFSASFKTRPEFSNRLLFKGIKFIFIFLYPIILIIITFSYEGISLWLGEEFAKKSYLVLQLLSLGILINGVAFLPFNYLQGIGRPDIMAKIHLIELPIYLLVMWIVIKNFGINGAAFIWLFRIIIDTTLLFLVSRKFIYTKSLNFYLISWAIGFIAVLVFPLALNSFLIKIIFFFSLLLIFSLITWKLFLSSEDQSFIMLKLKPLLNK